MTLRIRQFFRLLHINFILAKHGLDNIILSLRLFAPLRFLIYFNPWNWFRPKEYQRGLALRHALEELGPIFVKFGQALSTRRDLLPTDIADELARLQDRVPPFSSEVALKIMSDVYGMPPEQLFAHFDEEPLASASIAQVHAATLKSGQHVIVKILRPNLHEIIRRDVDLLYLLAKLADRYWPKAYRLRPIEIVREFEKTLFDELNLMREAANASQLRRNFKGSHELYIPEIYWEYTREQVLVQERIYGIPIYDLDQLRAHGVNFKKLAERGIGVFFTQVFRDCFFHADMHPGNLFVSFERPHDPQIIAVDFGIVGSLSDNDQRYLAANFLAFFNRDYRLVAQLHIDSGWIPKNTRIDELEQAMRAVCEPIFERPLKDISMAQLMMQLIEIGRRFEMELQPQLVMLQKTLFAIEGLGRHLYPDLDLWSTARPYLENWVKQQMGPRNALKRLHNQNPYWFEDILEVPVLMHRVLKHVDSEQRATDAAQYSNRKSRHPSHKMTKGFVYGVGSTFLLSALLTTLPVAKLSVGLAGLGLLAITLAWLRD